MSALRGFSVRGALHDGPRRRLLRVRRESDGTRAALVYTPLRHSADMALARAVADVEALQALSHPHVARVLDVARFEDGVGLLLEDFAGTLLQPPAGPATRATLGGRLELVCALCEGLQALHDLGRFHGDLRPSRVAIDPHTGAPKLLPIAPHLDPSRESPDPEALRYAAPEATGAMNRSVDSRSDLYALGVMLHELLTGRCPFVSDDPLELVHAHVARVPDAPGVRVPELPPALSAMVVKLLEKDPEARYQSAAGLGHDLREVLDHVQRGAPVPDDFELARRDRSREFRIPQRLYGREREIGMLHDAYARTAAGGFEPLLVYGYSGIGKSSLIHELQPTAVASGGLIATGKYDQFNRANPYTAIQQALEDLVRHVLMQAEEVIEEFRARLIGALGDEGQCLVDVAPLLAELIGPQPPLAEVGPVSQQNRFKRNCNALLRVFAAPAHPLVVVLDDVQWADSASLELMRSWLREQIPHSMFVFAYRDNEVGPDHPLALLLQEAADEGCQPGRVRLGPLPAEPIAQLLSDTLARPPREVAPLARALDSKTGGNPFFLRQHLRDLFQEKLLRFADDRWHWDVEAIAARGVTENVVDLMTRKLRSYDEATRSALQMCAVLSAGFPLRTLAQVLEESPETTYRRLLPAITDGLLASVDARLVFAHDKVQEAAYGLLPEGPCIRRHHRVGRHLLATLSEAELEEHLFKICDDLNRSRALIESPHEQRELVELNVRGGRRALASSAFGPAAALFEIALEMLPADAWEAHPQLAFATHFHGAQAHYACARYERCEALYLTCLAHEQDPVANAPVVQLLMHTYFSQNRHEQCVKLGLEHARRLGVRFPERPTKLHVTLAYLATKLRQGFRSTPSLEYLPAATDPRAIAALSIFNALVPSSYMIDTDLMALVALKMAQLSLRYGNTIYAPFAYTVMHITEGGVFKSLKSALRYSDLSFAVYERYPNPFQHAQITMGRSSFVRHQAEPLEGWERDVHAAITLGVDSGSLNYADYAAAFTRSQSLFFGTRPLDEVYRANADLLAMHRKHGDGEVIANQEFVLRTLARWRDALDDPDLDPAVARFDEEAYAERLRAPGNITPRGYLTVARQAQLYLEGDYRQSLRVGLDFMLRAIDLLGVMTDHVHRFLFMLAYLAVDRTQLGFWARVRAALYFRVNRAIFRVYDRNAPSYRSHLTLVEAEVHRRAGRFVPAVQCYEQAIEQARPVTRFNESIALLRLTSLLHERGLAEQAHAMAARTHARLTDFGFTQEQRRLEQQHPALTRPPAATSEVALEPAPRPLAIESLVRGAQAISQQVRMEGAVEALLRQLCQSSVARRVVLLLQENGELRIRGEVALSARGEQHTLLRDCPLASEPEDHPQVPASLIQLVARTRETQVLAHACRHGHFTRDPYIRQHGSKSVLCMPIVRQAKLVGVLFMENELATDAFEAGHLELLEVMASQAAITFENARLYQNLEREVEQRTHELRQMTQDIAAMLQNLEQGVFTIARGGIVHPAYSRHLETLLGSQAIAGRPFEEVLFADSDVSADQVAQVRAAVGFSLGSEVLWYEANSHLLLREVPRRGPDGRTQTWEVNWSPIVDDDGVVEKVLVSVRDVTELRELQQSARERGHDLEAVGEILSMPRASFLEFVAHAQALVTECDGRLSKAEVDAEDVAQAFRLTHTLKGNARTRGLRALAAAAHAAEEVYAAARSAPATPADPSPLRRAQQHVASCLARYRRVYEDTLEPFGGIGRDGVRVDEALLNRIRTAAEAPSVQGLSALLQAVGTWSLEDLVASIEEGVRDAARVLHRPAPTVHVDGHGVRVQPAFLNPLRDALTHVLRNAVAHGIEAPTERERRGKPPRGRLEVTARAHADGCHVIIRDDGQGLDVEALRASAQAQGMPLGSDAEVVAALLQPGVSTATEVSDVAGRGVGIDAANRALMQLGGRLELALGPRRPGARRALETRLVLPESGVLWLSTAANDVQAEATDPEACPEAG